MTRAPSSPITMQEVARRAGVSAMTVSRALKNDASVSPRTLALVLEVVRQTGYVPDATARVFASGRSGFVAVLVPSINNSNFADTTRGMSAKLELLIEGTSTATKPERPEAKTRAVASGT